MASLCGELRDQPALQPAFTTKLKEIVAAMGGDEKEAMTTMAPWWAL